MRRLFGIPLLCLALAFCGGAEAALNCPPMPAAVTTISKDVKSDINLTVGGLGKLKAGDLAVKTEVASKNLFEKYPNVDKLLALQTMAATYCQMLNTTAISDKDRLDRWEKFQDKVLELQTKPEPAKLRPDRPPVRRLPSDNSILTIPSEDCLVSKNCPHPFLASFSPSGNEIAYGNRNGEVRIWSISSKKELDQLSGLRSSIYGLSWDESAKRIIGYDFDGRVVIWDVQSGKPLLQFGDRDRRYRNVAWSRDFSRIALVDRNSRPLLWSSEAEAPVELGDTSQAIDITPDGGMTVSSHYDGSITLRSGIVQRNLEPRSDRQYEEVRFSAGGKSVLAADGDGNFRGWNSDSGELIFSKVIPGGGIRKILPCPNDQCIIVRALNGGVFVYSSTGHLESELTFKYRAGFQPADQLASAWSMAVSNDGKFIAAGSVQGEVVVWERLSGKQVQYFVGHFKEQISDVSFSPDGRFLASACFDGTVKVWRLRPDSKNGPV